MRTKKNNSINSSHVLSSGSNKRTKGTMDIDDNRAPFLTKAPTIAMIQRHSGNSIISPGVIQKADGFHASVSLAPVDTENVLYNSDQLQIDTIKLLGRAPTGVDGNKQGDHTIADKFIKKHQKVMTRGESISNFLTQYNLMYDELAIEEKNPPAATGQNDYQQKRAEIISKIPQPEKTFFEDGYLEGDEVLAHKINNTTCKDEETANFTALLDNTELKEVAEAQTPDLDRYNNTLYNISKGKVIIDHIASQNMPSRVWRKLLKEIIITYNRAYSMSYAAAIPHINGSKGRNEKTICSNLKKYIKNIIAGQNSTFQPSPIIDHIAALSIGKNAELIEKVTNMVHNMTSPYVKHLSTYKESNQEIKYLIKEKDPTFIYTKFTNSVNQSLTEITTRFLNLYEKVQLYKSLLNNIKLIGQTEENKFIFMNLCNHIRKDLDLFKDKLKEESNCIEKRFNKIGNFNGKIELGGHISETLENIKAYITTVENSDMPLEDIFNSILNSTEIVDEVTSSQEHTQIVYEDNLKTQ